MSDDELKILKGQLAKLKEKTRDLERRIQERQGLPVSDPAQLVPSATDSPYQRQTRPLRWSIHCGLCKHDNQEAIRYPGRPPSICDKCYAGIADTVKDHQDARNEVKKNDLLRDKNGEPPRRKPIRLDEENES